VQWDRNPESIKEFDTFRGRLRKIFDRTVTYQKEGRATEIRTWNFEFYDDKGVYVVSMDYSGNVAFGLMNSLSSIMNFGEIKLEAFIKDGKYPRIKVFNDGERQWWSVPPEEAPKIKYVMVGKKEVRDDTERCEFVEKLAYDINCRLEMNGEPAEQK
jgi:hypothetical protein